MASLREGEKPTRCREDSAGLVDRAEWLAKGYIQGQRDMLVRLLEHRFPTDILDEVRSQIANASHIQLGMALWAPAQKTALLFFTSGAPGCAQPRALVIESEVADPWPGKDAGRWPWDEMPRWSAATDRPPRFPRRVPASFGSVQAARDWRCLRVTCLLPAWRVRGV